MYRARLTDEALEDLHRLEDFLLDAADRTGDDSLPERAMAALRRELRVLETNPYTCRMADGNPFERELVIPFGRTGYVALFEIVSEHEIVIMALRHQREDDFC